jgi:predicted GTPase
MENMKSLADQLREQLVKPSNKNGKQGNLENHGRTGKNEIKVKAKQAESALLVAILAYDTTLNKSMVHARFDEKTVRLMNQFKMATDVDVSRLVSFAVKQLFETYPELKTIIKQFIQNTEL